MFEITEQNDFVMTKIKVIGIGGAGGNAINTMIEENLENVEYIAMNTDLQDLRNSQAPNLLQLGPKTTRGRGAGANPDEGEKAAEESYEEIKKQLQGADMVFLTAGMGGGTGTGAIPVVAKAARELDILSVAIVTKPFMAEGEKKREYANQGISKLKGQVDTFILIENEKLLGLYGSLSIKLAYKESDKVLLNGIKAISDIIRLPGYANVEFSDITTVVKNMGYSMIGTGIAEGENRAINAAHEAISDPLLDEVSVTGCKALLINVFGGDDVTLDEYNNACNTVTNDTGKEGVIITGLILDSAFEGKIRVTVFATGLDYQDIDNQSEMIERDTNPFIQEITQPAKKTLRFNSKDFGSKNTTIAVEEPSTEEATNELELDPSEVPAFLRNLD